MPKKVEKKKLSFWLVAGILAMLAIVIATFVEFANPTDMEYLDEEVSDSFEVGVTAEDIIDNPEDYYGDEVIVNGEVEQWLGPRAFLLDAEGIINDSLLVITRSPQLIFEDPEIFGDAVWRVDGEVQQLIVREVWTDYDLDLDPQLVVDYETGPYVLADTITQIED